MEKIRLDSMGVENTLTCIRVEEEAAAELVTGLNVVEEVLSNSEASN
jgi:hypothetical protein